MHTLPAPRALLVFDFDGVVADSEVAANEVLVALARECGIPMTREQSLALIGRRIEDLVPTIEGSLGRALPADFASRLQDRTLQRFRSELQAVDGVHEFLAEFAPVPRCIASSSSPERIATCLATLDLAGWFGDAVFSASQVARGKPHPDVFLHAARRMGVAPRDCIVLEDSPSGVRGAVAAGMRVIGLLAASHLDDGHERVLALAGADRVAATYAEAAAITRAWLTDAL